MSFKILSLDQATKVSGYSIYTNGVLKHYGTVESSPDASDSIERMRQMEIEIERLIDRYKPNWVTIEGVEFHKNFKVYGQLSQLQGVLFSLFFRKQVGFTVIETTAWRSWVGVKGKKRDDLKASAIQLVRDRFGIEASEDTCEAILQGVWASENITQKGEA